MKILITPDKLFYIDGEMYTKIYPNISSSGAHFCIKRKNMVLAKGYITWVSTKKASLMFVINKKDFYDILESKNFEAEDSIEFDSPVVGIR